MAGWRIRVVFCVVVVLLLTWAIPFEVEWDCFTVTVEPVCALAEEEFVISDGVLTKYVGTSRNVVVPGSVTSIGDSAFADNTYIESVTLPLNMVKIGEYAFSGCTALTSIYLPASLEEMGDYAFQNTGLTYVVIPGSLETIPQGAFRECSVLNEVYISDGVKRIADTDYGYYPERGAFANCGALTSVVIDGLSMVSIGQNAFYNCGALCDINLTEGIQSVGYQAFKNCGALAEISLPASLTDLSAYAFSTCFSLRSVWLGNIKNMGEYAFEYTGLTGVVIPGTLETIPQGAFRYCESLRTVTVEGGVKHIADSTYDFYPEWGAFAGCTALERVYINSDTMLTIGQNAFYDCKALAHVDIIEGLTDIGAQAFMNCGSLTITLPASINTLGANAFAGGDGTTVWVNADSAAYNYCVENAETQGFTYRTLGDRMYVEGLGVNALILKPGETTDVVGVIRGSGAKITEVYVDIYCIDGGAVAATLLQETGLGGDEYSLDGKVVLTAGEKIGSTDVVLQAGRYFIDVYAFDENGLGLPSVHRAYLTVASGGQCETCNEAVGPVAMNKTDASCVAPQSWDDVYYCSVCGEQSASYHVEIGETTECNMLDGPYPMNVVEVSCTTLASWDDVYYCTGCGAQTGSFHVELEDYAECNQDVGPVQADQVEANCQSPASWYDVYFCSMCGKETGRYYASGEELGPCNEEIGPVAQNHQYVTGGELVYWEDAYFCSLCGKESARFIVDQR